jgi:hypothetical protein
MNAPFFFDAPTHALDTRVRRLRLPDTHVVVMR